MEEDIFLLLGALENILGKMDRKARGNYAAFCPFCGHYKKKLEINLDANSPYFQCWECWVCGEKGRTIKSLLRHLKVSPEEAHNVLQFVKKGECQDDYYSKPENAIRLPDEYQLLYTAPLDSYEANRAKGYLYKRGLTEHDLIKYNIGYCESGKYKDRIIVPSYDLNNQLNYFVARSYSPNAFLKYLNPDVPKDKIVAFENMVDWNQPIILCEGVFDALALRNAVPLLGKRISSALMKKIIENPVPQVYICLDSDARKDAIRNCEVFLDMGKEVFLVELPGKDPSELGRYKMNEILQQAKDLTFLDLVQYKMDI